jgi:hypothetical protein
MEEQEDAALLPGCAVVAAHIANITAMLRGKQPEADVFVCSYAPPESDESPPRSGSRCEAIARLVERSVADPFIPACGVLEPHDDMGERVATPCANNVAAAVLAETIAILNQVYDYDNEQNT